VEGHAHVNRIRFLHIEIKGPRPCFLVAIHFVLCIAYAGSVSGGMGEVGRLGMPRMGEACCLTAE
jgi:hypothetical protein